MMFVYLFVFTIGACVGSFLSLLIYREVNEEDKKPTSTASRKAVLKQYLPSWLVGRSYCDHCKKPIKWYDNIPLLAYCFLRGRCRYCHKKIPLQYPLLEFLTGIQFVWVYFLLKSNLGFFSRFEGFYSFVALIYWLLIGAFLLMIFVSDVQYQIIPDSGVFFLSLLVLVKTYFDYLFTGYVDWSIFQAAFLASGLFAGIVLLTKGKGMGWGDVKLAFPLGLMVGFPQMLVGLWASFLTGGLFGAILILVGRKKLKQAVAFGPFLILGNLITLFWGQKIILWYLNLLF